MEVDASRKVEQIQQGLVRLKMLYEGKQYVAAIEHGKILEKDPLAPVGVFYLIARAYDRQNQFEAALKYYQRSIDLVPDRALFHLKKANSLKQLQRFDEAVMSYQAALRLNKEDFETNFNYANLLVLLNQQEQALAQYDRIIEMHPNMLDAYINKTSLLSELERYDAAEQCAKQAIALAPEPKEIYWLSLMRILSAQEKWDASLKVCEHMKSLWPNSMTADINMAMIYTTLGKYAESKQKLDAVLTLVPNNYEALRARFELHFRSGIYKSDEKQMLQDTIVYCQQNIQRAVGEPEDNWLLIADCYYTINQVKNAIKSLDNITHRSTAKARSARDKQASFLIEKGRFAEAKVVLEKWNTPQQLAKNSIWGKLGAYLNNWQQHWDCTDPHYSNVEHHSIQHCGAKAWDGDADLNGKKILLIGKWGIGDVVQMSRFCVHMKQKYPSVKPVLLIKDKLQPLYENSLVTDNCEVVLLTSEAKILLPQCDYYVSMMGLAKRLQQYDPKTFWPGNPYLNYDQALSQKLRKRYKKGQKKVIGFSWFGGFHFIQQDYRSIALEKWQPLIEAMPSQWLSLQYGACGDEIDGLNKKLKQTVLVDRSHNTFDELDYLAAQIMACDLVITIDNSTAHIAGALGKETWTLLPYVAEPRWTAESETTPWYPDMTLFRQAEGEGWENVLGRVQAALASFVA